MKVALVYDRVNKWGGAERMLLVLHEMFPDAPLYTSVYNSETAPWAKVFPKVIPSFLQKFPFAKTRHDLYAPLMPLAFESFDFLEYDLVISVTSEAAKGIITSPKTKHLCYLLTPTRYLWSGYKDYFNTSFKRSITRPIISYLRKWDKVAAERPDKIIAISDTVKERIKKYYGREAEVVHPTVELTVSWVSRVARVPREYYLVVSRLVPYKRVDLVVEAFNRNGRELVIVGKGSKERNLRIMSRSNKIHFAGLVGDGELIQYYNGCKALIFPQEEDFGIVAVEAQLFGKPVIAYRAGGACETIKDGETGIFFEKQTVEDISRAIQRFESMEFRPATCRKNALRFSKKRFKKEFLKEVAKIC